MRAIVLGTAGLLLVLATVNALIVAAFAVRDSARNHATLRAVGATPRQTVAVVVVSQLGACLLAVALGLPLGLGLWGLMDGGDLPPVDVGATTLLAIAAAVPVAFAVLVSLPALRQARRAPPPRSPTNDPHQPGRPAWGRPLIVSRDARPSHRLVALLGASSPPPGRGLFSGLVLLFPCGLTRQEGGLVRCSARPWWQARPLDPPGAALTLITRW